MGNKKPGRPKAARPKTIGDEMTITSWAQMQPRAFFQSLLAASSEGLAPDLRTGHFKSKRVAILDARGWKAPTKSKHPVWDFLRETHQVGVLPYFDDLPKKAAFSAAAARSIVRRMGFGNPHFGKALFVAVKDSDVFEWVAAAEQHIEGFSCIFVARGSRSFRVVEREFAHE